MRSRPPARPAPLDKQTPRPAPPAHLAQSAAATSHPGRVRRARRARAALPSPLAPSAIRTRSPPGPRAHRPRPRAARTNSRTPPAALAAHTRLVGGAPVALRGVEAGSARHASPSALWPQMLRGLLPCAGRVKPAQCRRRPPQCKQSWLRAGSLTPPRQWHGLSAGRSWQPPRHVLRLPTASGAPHPPLRSGPPAKPKPGPASRYGGKARAGRNHLCD